MAIVAKMPKQKPGKSRQDYATPKVLLDAVRRRLGIRDFDIDLAAHKRNKVCYQYLGPDHADEDHRNALASWVRWKRGRGWSWLNPPFANIYPWTWKAQRESSRYGARIAMLVPLSLAQWWCDHVHDSNVVILLLVGRVTFKGETSPYPKDCCVLLFGSGLKPGYYLWRWNDAKR